MVTHLFKKENVTEKLLEFEPEFREVSLEIDNHFNQNCKKSSKCGGTRINNDIFSKGLVSRIHKELQIKKKKKSDRS